MKNHMRQTNQMKHLDIYRWSYKEPVSRDIIAPSYWCTTQIGVVIGDKFIDTYWGWPPDREYVEGRKWHLDKIEDKLDLEFIANLDDLELLTDVPEWYENVIDLTHSNTHQNLKFVRKGQQRSIKMRLEDLQRQMSTVQSEIEYKTLRLKSLQRDIQELMSENENG